MEEHDGERALGPRHRWVDSWQRHREGSAQAQWALDLSGTRHNRRMTRVLIVDDDPSICQIVATLLTFEGYQVDTAPDGRAALQRIGVTVPDVVVADVNMPHLNGFELLAALRADPALAVVRVVLASGLTDGAPGTGQAGEQADARIVKPFTRAQLLAALRSVGC